MSETYAFSAGEQGQWIIRSVTAAAGEGLAPAPALGIGHDAQAAAGAVAWRLRGTLSNARYATRAEVTALRTRQQGLMRPEATCAALIPIRKSPAWWDLAQDERRAIFEETSHHTAIGLDYLPAVARRLHHSRDLGESFDFLTWFEFAPEHEADFDRMLTRLRATREWDYVEREVDIRLIRNREP